MLALAGITIGSLTSDAAIYNIGQCIGRGTIISIFITLFVLPQILLVGDTIISKTAFVMNMPLKNINATGLVRVDGAIRGRINGVVTGTMSAIIRGDVSAFIDAGNLTTLEEGTGGELSDIPEKIPEDVAKVTEEATGKSEEQTGKEGDTDEKDQ